MKRLSAAIALRTKAALGIRLTPHRFRDAAATTLAIEDPLHVRAAAPSSVMPACRPPSAIIKRPRRSKRSAPMLTL